MKRYTQIEFIDKCNSIHKNNSYSYEKTLYINNDIKIVVTCKEHGDFYITPKNHLKGQKCKKCAYLYRDNRKSTLEHFIRESKKIHGEKYEYSKVEYKNARSKVEIICKLHGSFFIKPGNHTNGKQGCKDCGTEFSIFKRDSWIKRSNNRPCIFYILKLWNDEEVFYKFGITSKGLKKRYGNSINSYKFEVIKERISEDAGYIWDLEKRFKRFKKNNKYTPLKKFSGVTECFKN
jgi:hypothetical protein